MLFKMKCNLVRILLWDYYCGSIIGLFSVVTNGNWLKQGWGAGLMRIKSWIRFRFYTDWNKIADASLADSCSFGKENCLFHMVYTGIGLTRSVSRLIYAPRYRVLPSLNIFHRMSQPTCASMELMYRSCLSSASASEQLGPESFSSIVE